MITNLQVQRRANKPQREGDIFRLLLPDGLFLSGRVVGANLPSGRAPMPSAHLLYIYSHRTKDPVPDITQLRPDRLLLPPFFTNLMLWTKGYAVTFEHVEIAAGDLLTQHCFRDSFYGRYVDEVGRPLEERHEPCGEWDLGSYRKLDDLISDALGIERVPLQPGDEEKR
jgi:hypothetical protein